MLKRTLIHAACYAVCLCIVVLLPASCRQSTLYHQSGDIDISGWHSRERIVFDVPPVADDGVYDAFIEFRLSGNYPFMQLAIAVERLDSAGSVMSCDTVCTDVYDETGRMLGTGVNYFAYTTPFKTYRFHAGDSLRLSMRHVMPVDTLSGVADIALRLQR